MLGFRQKLSLGFRGIFLIILIIGIQSIIHLSKLGESIVDIFSKNEGFSNPFNFVDTGEVSYLI